MSIFHSSKSGHVSHHYSAIQYNSSVDSDKGTQGIIIRKIINDMTSFDSLSSTQKLRAALHRDVRCICSETCHLIGLEITKPAMEIVAELVYKKLSLYGTDLEAFAKHAKRSTINSDDVKLLVRRNPSLKNHLNAMAPTTATPKEKRRKTVASIQPVTPVPKHKELEKIRDIEKTEGEKTDAVENMAVDDTIDLTFD